MGLLKKDYRKLFREATALYNNKETEKAVKEYIKLVGCPDEEVSNTSIEILIFHCCRKADEKSKNTIMKKLGASDNEDLQEIRTYALSKLWKIKNLGGYLALDVLREADKDERTLPYAPIEADAVTYKNRNGEKKTVETASFTRNDFFEVVDYILEKFTNNDYQGDRNEELLLDELDWADILMFFEDIFGCELDIDPTAFPGQLTANEAINLMAQLILPLDLSMQPVLDSMYKG